MDYTKADLINELSAIHGYRSYLEICTPTTGNMYGAVDRAKYSTCHRLIYRCPDTFDDGMPIDFRSTTLDIAECVQAIQAKGLKYDVILVDPFHEHEPTFRDIKAALDLLVPAGTVIVHDCYPRDGTIALPQFIRGPWCGVTYKAYLDFVLAHRQSTMFCTIDIDYGCGIIRHDAGLATFQRDIRRVSGMRVGDLESPAARQWQGVGEDHDAAFNLIQTHPGPLLNLVTVHEFLNGERAGLPVLV